MEEYKDLEFDSNLFNYKVAEIKHQYSTFKLKSILTELKEQDYTLVYGFFNNKINDAIGSFKSQLVDEKTLYKKKILYKNSFDKNISEYQCDYAVDSLINLAIASGVYSRFNIDEGIEDGKFRELYKLWIVNSVNKKIAEKVFVYLDEQDIVGVITLVKKNERAYMGIIAVDEKHRRNGIAKLLIKTSENWALSEKKSELTVVTQGKNIPACNLYESCGYKKEKIEYVYHFWLK